MTRHRELAGSLRIRDSLESDTDAIRTLLLRAFGEAEGAEIAGLVDDLSADPSARPLLSLVACSGTELVGHIMFSNAEIDHRDPITVSASILAPLAVHPEMQARGIGARLIRTGLNRLLANGTGFVFVLGYPGYYSRHGFTPALAQGFHAPYPIPDEHTEAWMVQPLGRTATASFNGRVVCARALDDPRYWRE